MKRRGFRAHGGVEDWARERSVKGEGVGDEGEGLGWRRSGEGCEWKVVRAWRENMVWGRCLGTAALEGANF